MIEVDSAVAKAAIECDLNCYANQWRQLQLDEVEDAYGPLFPEPTDIDELRRKGNCIHDEHNLTLPGISSTWEWQALPGNTWPQATICSTAQYSATGQEKSEDPSRELL